MDHVLVLHFSTGLEHSALLSEVMVVSHVLDLLRELAILGENVPVFLMVYRFGL